MELYKYFKKKEYKDDFLQGRIRLGTFELYRGIENRHQGDPYEAINSYLIENETFTPERRKELEETVPFAKNLFRSIASEETTIQFVNTKINHRLVDSYIVCATTERNDEFFREDFGPYCIKIKNPTGFLLGVTHALIHKLQTEIVDYMGEVSYDKDVITSFLNHTNPALIKHAEPYAVQKEFRFVWELSPLPTANLDVITVSLNKDLADILFEDLN